MLSSSSDMEYSTVGDGNSRDWVSKLEAIELREERIERDERVVDGVAVTGGCTGEISLWL